MNYQKEFKQGHFSLEINVLAVYAKRAHYILSFVALWVRGIWIVSSRIVICGAPFHYWLQQFEHRLETRYCRDFQQM